ISDRNLQGKYLIDGLMAVATDTQKSARAYLESSGARYIPFWIANIIAVRGDRSVVDALARIPEVVLIEPDRAFAADLDAEKPGDVLSGVSLASAMVQPNLTQVHAPEVWARGGTGIGSVYAVADTGVYWQHSALISQYRGWDGATAMHDYNWWDAVHLDINGGGNPCGFSVQSPCDDYGHGTHVAGIGVGDDGYGHQIGMAPGARWIACRNMDSGVGRPSTYMECFQFFIAPTRLDGTNPRPDLRPDVISNSYSCPDSELCSVHAMEPVLEAVRAAGIFMSVSAGNNGAGCETIADPPALEQSVFTIGAVDNDNVIASFSSRGPVTVDLEPLMKPNLVAPGVFIVSSLKGGGYGYMSGTSMAAPHVAGAVSLLWGAFPSLRRNVAATETLLSETALPITTSQGCGGDGSSQVPNNVYGWGLLDVKAAYDAYWPLQPKYFFPLIGRSN
ncbi:MAG: S8 family serine peptidase, partial [Anaerolineaceae bacterium]